MNLTEERLFHDIIFKSKYFLLLISIATISITFTQTSFIEKLQILKV